VESFGTAHVDEATIEALIAEHFDLRPKGIVQMLNLLRPIYRQTASNGHFGRSEPDLTWERTDKADDLRSAAGLKIA
jgi:S-adenosylmethionine synthetase